MVIHAIALKVMDKMLPVGKSSISGDGVRSDTSRSAIACKRSPAWQWCRLVWTPGDFSASICKYAVFLSETEHRINRQPDMAEKVLRVPRIGVSHW